ncbi:hypothetical protein [Nocardia vaccinii]|uniref:hypothetical protein n=1 Tax=Nocardia vaccinii TaxID=1822 RepID=UPI0008344896|nr:hypothetical protein [Nocardia vaccinii]
MADSAHPVGYQFGVTRQVTVASPIASPMSGSVQEQDLDEHEGGYGERDNAVAGSIHNVHPVIPLRDRNHTNRIRQRGRAANALRLRTVAACCPGFGAAGRPT